MKGYIIIRSLVILLMVILMTIGLVTIILSIIAMNFISENSKAVRISWFNDIQCNPNITCPVPSDDKLWNNTEDVHISKGRAGYQNSVARRCTDLIARIVIAEKTAQISSPPSLVLHGTFHNYEQDPNFGGLWLDSKNTAWIAFRGTLSGTLREWQDDFTYNQESLPSSKSKSAALQRTFVLDDGTGTAQVHSGFMDVYNMFRKDLLKTLKDINPDKIVISGHSLGGGVSTLCAVDLASTYPGKVVSYTFAAPRVGDSQLCKLIDERLSIYRIVNNCDIVPTLPYSVCPNFDTPNSPFFYQQCGIPFVFTSNWKSIGNNHELAVYVNGLQLTKFI